MVSGQIDAVTDAEVFQEILYRYLHIGERDRGLRIFDYFHRIMLGRILSVEDADVSYARDLAEQYPGLSPRDLIHLSIALRHQIPEIITADRGFDTVGSLHRLDPTAFAADH
jgi:predicted nucleic acid-binding protein